MERVRVFVLFSKRHSLIQLPPFIYFTLIINTSCVPMTAKSKQKNIPGKLEGYYLWLRGRNEWSAKLSRY